MKQSGGQIRARNLRVYVAAALVLLFAKVAHAEEWSYEDGEVPIAYIDNGAAQLQFACRGGDLTVGYWVRAPHRQVIVASAVSVAITPDERAGSADQVSAGSSFAQEIPLIHNDGASVIIRGPVARQWARIVGRAAKDVRLAYVRPIGQGGFDVFDSHSFGAKGSAIAIKKVIERCG